MLELISSRQGKGDMFVESVYEKYRLLFADYFYRHYVYRLFFRQDHYKAGDGIFRFPAGSGQG
jgi:hypothetical protein